MTERESAHPSPQQLSQLYISSRGNGNGMSTPTSTLEDNLIITDDDDGHEAMTFHNNETSGTTVTNVSKDEDISNSGISLSNKSQPDETESSSSTMSRSKSMPLSQTSSPNAKHRSSVASSSRGSNHSQMQRSFSVLSAGVS